MKKFLLTSCAILSAIGVQAQSKGAESYLTQNGVKYKLTLTSNKSGKESKVDAVSVTTTNASNGIISMSDEATITRTDNYYYTGIPQTVEDGITAVEFKDFSQTIVNGTVDTGNSTTEYTPSDANYGEKMLIAQGENANIYSYSEMVNANDANIYVYFEYSTSVGSYRMNDVNTLTELQNGYTSYNSAYYYKNTVNGNVVYYAIYKLTSTERTFTTITDIHNCTVEKLTKRTVLIDNEDVTSVTIGKNVTEIAEGLFQGTSNLSLFTVETNGNYVYQNGILYSKDKTKIIAASCNVTSQTIPNTVNYIYEDAFYNVTNNIVITSLNSALDINGNSTSYVTFLKPSATLTKTQAANGGYTVTGQVTNTNIGTITIEGTYIDFRNADILEDISITNTGNTLLYFATDKNVTGNKNIINNNICANCVITDNASDKFYCPSKFTAENLSYDREFNALWKTITLPFSANINKNNILVGEFREYMEDDHLFAFYYSQSVVANRPYIIKTASDDKNATYKFENISDAIVEKSAPEIVNEGPANFYGNYETKTLTSNDVTNYYGIKNTYNEETGHYKNEVVKCLGATIKPFRAFLSGPASDLNAVKIRLVDAMDQVIDEIEMPMTTGVEELKAEVISDNVYNLNGQSVKASRGLNIINGKVVINK